MKKIFIFLFISILFLAGCSGKNQGITVHKPSDSDIEDPYFFFVKEFDVDLGSDAYYNKYLSSIKESEDYVFFANKEGITRYNKKTKEMQTIYQSNEISKLYLYNNRLYFLNDKSDMLKSIDYDGKNEKTEIDLKIRPLDVMIYDNQFYIKTDQTTIKKYNVNSKELEPFLENAADIVFKDGHAYYSDKAARTFSLYSKNLQTGEVKLLRKEGFNFHLDLVKDVIKEFKILNNNIMIFDNQIYYTKGYPGKLYQYNESDDDTLINLAGASFECITYYKDKIYYVISNWDRKRNFYMYEYDPASKTNRFLANLQAYASTYGLAIVNDMVFFNTLYEEGDYHISNTTIDLTKLK